MSAENKKLEGQPNIILILTDQERSTMHFPDGWEEENLVNMTKLKQDGFTFNKNYCNTCMCSPSRSTLFAGSYPAHHGVKDTLTYGGAMSSAETQLDRSLPNLASMLGDEGYNVHYRGKWHLSKGDSTEDASPAEIATFGFKGWISPDAGEDTKPENFGGGYADHDNAYVQQAVKFLQAVKEGKEKEPFCLVVSLVNPHDVLAYPNQTSFGYSEADYSGRDIALPSTNDENLARNHKPTAHAQLRAIMQAGLGVLKNEDMELDYINFYGHLLTKIDQSMTPIIDELYDSSNGTSLADSSYVIRTGDHGELGMAHGGLRQKAFNMYDEAIRVPLIISNPIAFGNSSDQSTGNVSSLVDLLPTIGNLCNIDPANISSSFVGTDLTPMMFENDTPVQDHVLFTFDDVKAGSNSNPRVVNAADRIRAVIEKDWKYARYFDALGSYEEEYEMYDLKNDPNELNNVANKKNPDYYKPEYVVQRERLEKKLEKAEKELLIPTKNPVNENAFIEDLI
ncbi:MAG: hydrolase [Fluviicola sp.]|nr:MAG: hydrolase [Fluviicola sp.]